MSLSEVSHRPCLKRNYLPGFLSGPTVNWGNLCSCMGGVFKLFARYKVCFRPRPGCAPSGIIEWDVNSVEPFGECKEYDFLGTYDPFKCKAFYVTLFLIGQ